MRSPPSMHCRHRRAFAVLRGHTVQAGLGLLIGTMACNGRPPEQTHSEPIRRPEPAPECRQPPDAERARRVLAIAGEIEAGSSFEQEMRARFPAIHIREGQPVTLDNGLRLTLRNVGYAHMTESRNLAMARVTVTRAEQSQDVGLSQVLPGPICYTPVLGVWVGVEDTSAYHKPGSARLRVLEEGGSASPDAGSRSDAAR